MLKPLLEVSFSPVPLSILLNLLTTPPPTSQFVLFLETDQVSDDDTEEVVPWPERHPEPVDERNSSHILASSFPTLFPCGSGDVTYNLSRRHGVTFSDAIKHYVRYWDPSARRYPFAEHTRFLHYVQDRDERSRIQAQCSVYLQQNPEDADKTIGDLREDLRGSNNQALYLISKKMQRFGANINGSPAYMALKKKELLALMDQEGIGTVWYTLTMPKWMWQDLNILFGDPPDQLQDETDETYRKRRLQFAREKHLKSPHIINEFFLKRSENFIGKFFGPDLLDSTWTWYRVEWQKRGEPHLHGIARLKCAPDLTRLAKSVVDGRRCLYILHYLRGRLSHSHDFPDLLLHLDDLSETDKLQMDQFLEAIDSSDSSWSSYTNVQKEQYIHSLLDSVRHGKECEKKIVTFRDYIATSENPNDVLPSDVDTETRLPPVENTLHEDHPCSVAYTEFLQRHSYRTFCLTSPTSLDSYKRLVSWCQRHRHNQSYCMRKGVSGESCRFNFPRPIRSSTEVRVTDVVYKRGPMAGKIRTTRVELLFKTNDGWVNSHSDVGLTTYAANMDISVLVDETSVVEYVAKYCSKIEQPTKALGDIIRQAVRGQQEEGVENPRSILRKGFNVLSGRREKCETEVAHLLNSSSYVYCTHTFETVNLYSSIRRVNTEGTTSDALTLATWKDIYASRMSENRWKSPEVFRQVEPCLSTMCLRDFCKLHTKRSGKVDRRDSKSKPVVIVFSPDVRSDVDRTDYWKYAYTTLVRLIPWFDYEDSVVRMDRGTVGSLTTTPSAEVMCRIIEVFDGYFRTSSSIYYNSDNVLQRGLDQVLRDGESDLQSQQSQFSVDEVSSFDQIFRNMAHGRQGFDDDYNDASEMTWNQDHDFSVPVQTYLEGELDTDRLRDTWNTCLASVPNVERKVVHLTDFDVTDTGSKQQRSVVEVFQQIAGLWKDSSGNFLPPKLQPCESPNVMIVPGPAGTGRTTSSSSITSTTTTCLKHVYTLIKENLILLTALLLKQLNATEKKPVVMVTY